MVLSATGCRIWDGGVSQDVLLDCLFPASLSSSFLGLRASLHRMSQVLLSCRFQLCNSKKMNPKVPFEPMRILAPLGRCRDRGALHRPGVALPDFNDLGHILPLFSPFFLLLTPPQSLALEGYYCLCRSVPGHPHWQMLDLKSTDEKLSRHIRARGEGVCLCQGAG